MKGLDNHYLALPGLLQAGMDESDVLVIEFMLLTRSITVPICTHTALPDITENAFENSALLN